MANRRSLGDALSITPEKMAFIQGGKSTAEPAAVPTPTPSAAAAPITLDKVVAAPTAPAEESPAAEPERPTRTSSRRGRGRGRSDDQPAADALPFGMANLMVPVTTRLQPTTAAALKRAGLEQKLRGAVPSTVQEIVEIAVAEWLEEHDYL